MISNWKSLSIKDFGQVFTGRTPSRNNPEYWGDCIPFLTPSDMDGRRCITRTDRSLSQKGADALARVLIPHGVAVSCIGWQMGKAVQIRTPTVTNQQLNSVIPDEGLIDELFLYYSLSSKREEIFRLGAGGSRTPILKKSAFEKIKLTIPPLSEQKRIAAVLGALDDKIENNRTMNETLEAMAQAIFKSWFVDFDPVIDNALRAGNPIPSDLEHKAARRREVMARDNYKKQPYAHLFPDHFADSDLGSIPGGWEISPLDEVAHFLNGAACQKYPVEEDGEALRVIKIKELRSGCFSDRVDLATASIPEKWVVVDGDVIFSWSASLLVKIWCGGKGALNQHLFKVTSKTYEKWFYYYWTKFHLDQFIRIAESKATTMGHIKRSHLSEALCIVPTRQNLTEGHLLLGPILERVILNEKESHTLASLRDTLLPKLISGEIRVPEIEGLVEEAL